MCKSDPPPLHPSVSWTKCTHETKIKKFREDLAALDVGDEAGYDGLLTVHNSINETTHEGTNGTWVPFYKYARDNGEAVAFAVARAKSVPMQRHRRAAMFVSVWRSLVHSNP